MNLLIQDALHQQTLHIAHVNVQFLEKQTDEKQKSTIQGAFPNRVHAPRVRSYL